MKLFVQRGKQTADSTGGVMKVDGKYFGFTCEDEHRDVKIPGETRIPAGYYKIMLRTEGGMNSRYSELFPWHKGMLWLQDVPNFEWIYIHIGNREDHTAGCILVGYTADWENECEVGKSTQAYEDLYLMIVESLNNNESVYIEIRD